MTTNISLVIVGLYGFYVYVCEYKIVSILWSTTHFIMSFDAKVPSSESVDPELQSFIQLETQRAQFQGQVHKLTDLCWDQCVDKARDKLDSRTETCMSNCVERFIDTSLTIANRFQKLLQGNWLVYTCIHNLVMPSRFNLK